MYFELSVLGFYITTLMFLVNLATRKLSQLQQQDKQYLEIPNIDFDNDISKNTIKFFERHKIKSK